MKKDEGIVVVSLFGGVELGLQILKDLGVKVKAYYSFEIDKKAIQVAKYNHDGEIIHCGNVLNWKDVDIPWELVNLLLAGFPCQGFSKAGDMTNFEHPKSKLYFVFEEIYLYLKTLNDHFQTLAENVSMKPEWRDFITERLGLKVYDVNADLMTPIHRRRLFWSDIEDIEIPNQAEYEVREWLDDDYDESYILPRNFFDSNDKKTINVKHYHNYSTGISKWIIPKGTKKGFTTIQTGDVVDLTYITSKTRRTREMNHCIGCVTATRVYYCVAVGDWFRLLKEKEFERLMGWKEGYTECLNYWDAQKVIGNGWHKPTVELFLKNIKYFRENKSLEV